MCQVFLLFLIRNFLTSGNIFCILRQLKIRRSNDFEIKINKQIRVEKEFICMMHSLEVNTSRLQMILGTAARE